MVTKEDTTTNKKIELSDNQDEWNNQEAAAENEENSIEQEEVEEEVNTAVPKKVYVKEVLNKDKYGNVIIDKLGDYIEPSKTIKNSRQEDILASKDKFAGLLKAASDDENEKNDKPSDFSEFLQTEKENKKNELKNKKTQNKKNVDDGLDDILKEFGVDIKPVPVPVKKEKKVVEKKLVEEKKEEQPKTSETETKEAKETKDAKETEKKKKKPVTKSHLNDAKREILEKQEALKKKQKKQGN